MLKNIFGRKNKSKKKNELENNSKLLEDMDREKMPRHVAIIMDGNGRWAGGRGLVRSAGHTAGVKALKRALNAAIDFRLEALTVYAFSTENWKRPTAEVDFLMNLFSDYLEKELNEMDQKNVHIDFIGRIDGFSPALV